MYISYTENHHFNKKQKHKTWMGRGGRDLNLNSYPISWKEDNWDVIQKGGESLYVMLFLLVLIRNGWSRSVCSAAQVSNSDPKKIVPSFESNISKGYLEIAEAPLRANPLLPVWKVCLQSGTSWPHFQQEIGQIQTSMIYLNLSDFC